MVCKHDQSSHPRCIGRRSALLGLNDRPLYVLFVPPAPIPSLLACPSLSSIQQQCLVLVFSSDDDMHSIRRWPLDAELST